MNKKQKMKKSENPVSSISEHTLKSNAQKMHITFLKIILWMGRNGKI